MDIDLIKKINLNLKPKEKEPEKEQELIKVDAKVISYPRKKKKLNQKDLFVGG